MTRRSVMLKLLASAPAVGGLLLLAGCEQGGEGAAANLSREEQDKQVQESMDYMRKQYAAKGKKK